MEKRVSSLEEELENVKTDFEHLNMIYQSSDYENESSKPAKCENYEVLEAKVKFLVKTSSKLAMGTTNLNAVLGSQNCRAILHEVPNGRMKWIPKGSINSSRPKANRVPVFIK